MAAFAKAHDVARETLRRLATFREPPTPDNYQKHYNAVAGVVESGATHAAGASSELRDLLAHTLEDGVAARLVAQPELARKARELAGRARAGLELRELASALRRLWVDMELRGVELGERDQGLLRLFNLLMNNVRELLGEDQWLRGQLAMIAEILSGPIDSAKVSAAERRLRDVIIKQGVLKHSMDDAKSSFKQMVATFVTRLGDFSSSTGAYHEKIGLLGEKIRAADDIRQISSVIDEVMQETRSIQASAWRSHEDLAATRREVEAAERKIRELEAELELASEKVREDQLTGVLNRRGLDEAFERELAVFRRQGRPLAVALLDIDNFKKLNDTHGHQAGDAALVHLAGVIKETVRPADIVGRYGGEEFVILLPDATTEEATAVVKRLQRALTKHFFLNEDTRLLITFSAGVTHCGEAESAADIIARADKGLYQAKREGKNRTVLA